MSFGLSDPRVVDLTGASSLGEGDGCCDLCRTETELFRLVWTPDALCVNCFVMWHG